MNLTSDPVSDTVDSLMLELIEWVGPNPRGYAEVLEARRTSCPRLPVREDAKEHLRKHRRDADGRPR